MSDDNSIGDKLLIEEYKSCRELLLKNIDIMERNENYAVAAFAAIAVFAIQSKDHTVTLICAWLPLLIAALGFMRFYGLDDTIDKINGHLVEMEKRFDAIGWTTYYRANNSSKVLKKTRYGLWAALGIVALVGGHYVPIVQSGGCQISN